MKKATAILMATLLVLSLVPFSMASAAEPVTIKFANYALLETGYTEFWEGVKTGFEAQNPHVTIEWVTAPYGEIVTQVINMAGGGDKVDLMLGETGWTPTMEDVGLSVPVSAILTQEYLDGFFPNLLEAHEVNGECYALPLFVSPFILFYNTEIFAKAGLDPAAPPTTYDEMLEMAEKIAALTSDDGNKIYPFGQTTASRPVSGSSLTSMVYNFGGNVLEQDGTLSVDNEGFKQTFELLKLLEEKGYNPQNALLKDLRNLFALGQLAMYYDTSWGFNGISSINGDAASFTASAAPLAGGAGNGDSILQANTLIFMDNGEANREAVRLLVEYLITEEVLGDYMRTITPAYPATKAMDGMVGNPVLDGAADSISKTLALTFVPALSDFNLELCTLAQAITVGGEDVDSAIAAFVTAAQAILQ